MLKRVFSAVGVARPSDVKEKLCAVVSRLISVNSKVEFSPKVGSSVSLKDVSDKMNGSIGA